MAGSAVDKNLIYPADGKYRAKKSYFISMKIEDVTNI
jgi:hypothetical protein